MPHNRAVRLSTLSWLILALGLLISAFAALQVKRVGEADAVKNFAFSADQLAIKIEERLAAYALVLRGGAGLFDASDAVTREEWRQYAAKLQISEVAGGIEAIGFARLLRPEELAGHIAQMRAEGFADYRIRPAGRRPLYGTVLFLEPFRDRNLLALGYDMFSDPVRRAAMLQARDTGRAALTGKVELVTETAGQAQPATLMYVPVYRKGTSWNTLVQRRQALIGWSYGAYRMQDLMHGIFGDRLAHPEQPVGLRIFDGDRADPHQLLYQNLDRPHQAAPSPFFQQRLIDFNGRQWLLTFDHANPAAGIDHTAAWATLSGGTALSMLLFSLIRSMSRTRSRALALAEQLTGEIRQRERQFEQLLTRLQTIASRVPGVVYEYRLYPDGRSSFPYASEGIRQIYRISPEQARENAAAVFTAIHPDDLEDVAASIQRSADQLAPWRHEYRVRFEDGTQRWVFGDSVPHREEDGSISWYGVITDITARKQAELALRAANRQTRHFREALDQLSSYIYMKDTDSRYIYANRATLELFGCTAATLAGSRDEQFFPLDTARRLRQIDARVFAGEQTREEVESIGKDGRRTVFLEIKTPIYDEPEQQVVVGLLGISTDITPLKTHEQQLEQLAHYDALTNLPNRILLADRLHQAMLQARRHHQSLAVVYLDLDGFKAVNDHYGHAAGDKLLMTVAARMKEVIREGDTLCRLGGDEFVAILLDLNDVDASKPLLNRLLQAAARPVPLGRHRLQVSASLGVTFYPQAEELEPEQLLRQADQAMYQAKLAGKHRYHLFDAEQDRTLRSHHESLEHLRAALHAGEFVLFFQPKVNMRTGEVLGAEALLRWQHPQQGLLPPAHFLPIIEEHPLAVELGNWVIDAALQQIREWQQQGLSLPVSVNIGARQLRQRDFACQLRELLGHYPDIAPRLLELEVLETSALGDLAQISQLLEDCRGLGVGLSLDDFGTGYSSLTYLKRLPATIVKVDQSFIRDILEDPEDLAILDGILGLASAFGRQVIAEGVETREHGDMLLRIGCDLAQGYGIARPMPAAELPAWVARWRPEPHWAGLRRLNREELPLLYAGIEHRAWLQEVTATLTSGSRSWPPLDPELCRFGAWLAGQPPLASARREALAELHRRIHDQAEQLRLAHQEGRSRDAQALLATLFELGDQLLAQLESSLE
ncbi:EAL domain-containing protein [Zobellella taiwanensis]